MLSESPFKVSGNDPMKRCSHWLLEILQVAPPEGNGWALTESATGVVG